jgi:hypothetical protein
LTSNEPSAILPQARLAPSMPLAKAAVQRAPTKEAVQSMPTLPAVGRVESIAGAQNEVGASPVIQRSPEEKGKSTKANSQKAIRVKTPSTSKSSSVRRSPLPLAKRLSGSANKVVQRALVEKETEVFSGASATVSSRGFTQTQNLGGSEVVSANNAMSDEQSAMPSAIETSSEPSETPGRDMPNLDRLARAILPLVRRMLMIERERRNPRSIL